MQLQMVWYIKIGHQPWGVAVIGNSNVKTQWWEYQHHRRFFVNICPSIDQAASWYHKYINGLKLSNIRELKRFRPEFELLTSFGPFFTFKRQNQPFNSWFLLLIPLTHCYQANFCWWNLLCFLDLSYKNFGKIKQ